MDPICCKLCITRRYNGVLTFVTEIYRGSSPVPRRRLSTAAEMIETYLELDRFILKGRIGESNTPLRLK